jgi:hypothetical protein
VAIINNTPNFQLEVMIDGEGPYVIGRGQASKVSLKSKKAVGEHRLVAKGYLLQKYFDRLQIGKERIINFQITGELKNSPVGKVGWSKFFAHEDFFPDLASPPRKRDRKTSPHDGLELTQDEQARYQKIWKKHYIGGLIRWASQKHRVPAGLLTAIIAVESGFNTNAVSKEGALGLMQLMPKTCARFNVQRPFDPQENLEGGAKYLKYLLHQWSLRFPPHQRLELSLAAYNAGEHNVELYGDIPPFKETRDYVIEVLKRYEHMERVLAM